VYCAKNSYRPQAKHLLFLRLPFLSPFANCEGAKQNPKIKNPPAGRIFDAKFLFFIFKIYQKPPAYGLTKANPTTNWISYSL
jgi:hypothetical protein